MPACISSTEIRTGLSQFVDGVNNQSLSWPGRSSAKTRFALLPGHDGKRAGRNDMKRSFASLALVAAMALGGWASSPMPAHAAPPTVTPSPGYDARLQEQRAARTTYEPVMHPLKPVSRRHVKRIHDGAH
jgi:hypothetical protein